MMEGEEKKNLGSPPKADRPLAEKLSPKIKSLIALVLVVLVLAIGGYCLFKKIPSGSKTANDSTADSTTEENDKTPANFDEKSNGQKTEGAETENSENQTPPESATTQLKDASSYFTQAEDEAKAKNYGAAIASYQKAIDLDPNQERYYSRKAEAEVLAGKKPEAIATVEAGLKVLPSSTLLKNKLDILKATQ